MKLPSAKFQLLERGREKKGEAGRGAGERRIKISDRYDGRSIG